MFKLDTLPHWNQFLFQSFDEFADEFFGTIQSTSDFDSKELDLYHYPFYVTGLVLLNQELKVYAAEKIECDSPFSYIG